MTHHSCPKFGVLCFWNTPGTLNNHAGPWRQQEKQPPAFGKAFSLWRPVQNKQSQEQCVCELRLAPPGLGTWAHVGLSAAQEAKAL